LRWQVLWAPATALLVAGVLLGTEISAHGRLLRRLGEIADLREGVERALIRLEDRHERTVRRANEAILETQARAREALLAGTAEHYVREMERYAGEVRAALNAVHVTGTDAQLGLELDRLRSQVDRVVEQCHALAPTLDALLTATSAEDPDAVLAATQDLARADRSMTAILRTADAMLRRITSWQTAEALGTPSAVPRTAWLLVLLWGLSSLYLAYRPLARLGRLADGELLETGSPEERALARRLDELSVEREQLSRQVAERTRDAERGSTAARRAEQELALLRLYDENLVNSLRAAIVVTDANLVVRSFNRRARALLDLEDAHHGAPVEALRLFGALSAQARDTRALLERAIDAREPQRFESLLFSGSAGEVVLDLLVAPYMDESGAARGLLFVADDVTEAVHTKDQLLAAERLAAVGRISAQVAHEIRNPLSAIGLNAELLGDDFAQDLAEPRRSEAAKLLRAIAAEVERLTEVTEGYLQLTRLPRPKLRPVDLNQLVGDLMGMLREELRAHGVTAVLDLASPPPVAWVDPGQLRQALLNVLRNAREAMPGGGTLRLVTRADTQTATLEVDDSGAGIPADVLPRVFEPFFSTKVAGTGLGLPLTRQIIAEHGGTITLEPLSLDPPAQGPRGTRVIITVPRDARVLGLPAAPTADGDDDDPELSGA
jgi:signal transduction histidine kinase